MTVVLAFDLETAPDVDAGRRLYGLAGTDPEVAAAMLARRRGETKDRTDFLKPAFHRVVGLGAVAIDLGPSPEVRIGAWAGPDERALVARFLDYLRKRPQLVSWNGGGFDLPVIRYRALVHGLSAAALYGPPDQRPYQAYGYRYGDAHVDLMDVLDGYGASPALTLDELARLVGLPGKSIATGDQVAGLAFGEDWHCVEAYVGSDAIQTALLFLRWELGRGRLGVEAYAEALAAIRGKLGGESDLAGAIDQWMGKVVASPVAV